MREWPFVQVTTDLLRSTDLSVDDHASLRGHSCLRYRLLPTTLVAFDVKNLEATWDQLLLQAVRSAPVTLTGHCGYTKPHTLPTALSYDLLCGWYAGINLAGNSVAGTGVAGGMTRIESSLAEEQCALCWSVFLHIRGLLAGHGGVIDPKKRWYVVGLDLAWCAFDVQRPPSYALVIMMEDSCQDAVVIERSISYEASLAALERAVRQPLLHPTKVLSTARESISPRIDAS